MMLYDPFEVFIALAIPLGLLQCFFGYRLLMATMAMTGFLLFGAISSALMSVFTERALPILCAGIIGGVGGAVLLVAAHIVGVFVLGGAVGALVGGVLQARFPALASRFAIPFLVLAGGLAAALLRRHALIVFTSVLGSWLAVAGTLHFVAGVEFIPEIGIWETWPPRLRWSALLAWMFLAICGLIGQCRSTTP
jgi:hypothetical protein